MTSTTSTDLQRQLDAFSAQLAANAPAEMLLPIADGIQQLMGSDIVTNALREGDRAPDFRLPDATGGSIALSELLARGPVVLTFYRGEWCPFCNLTLRAYQKALPEFQRHGATLVAVSPQAPDNSLTTVEKKGLTFAVLSDVGNQVARQYRLVYRFDEALKQATLSQGIDLAQFNGTEEWELPVPATFVIAQDGTIRLAFVNPDFMQRLEPAAISDALAALR